MSKRNPVLSMTGNMWALLRLLRDSGVRSDELRRGTRDALVYRGFAYYGMGLTIITEHGMNVCDAFTEGQESTR